jgi:thiamine-phosphate pyrophosphorylase
MMGVGEATSLSLALRLMLVTDDRLLEDRDLVEACQAAEEGGVTSIQLRLKRVEYRRLLALARAVRTAIRIPLLVNDRVDVALAAGVAGAHLGPDDLPIAQARRFVPAGFWLGGSVGTESEIPGGAEADYWGVGPVRATSTKSDAGAALGVEGFERLRRSSAPLRPCVAIGGIQPEDVGALFAAGAAGVAVASGILDADDVMAAAARYRDAIPD